MRAQEKNRRSETRDPLMIESIARLIDFLDDEVKAILRQAGLKRALVSSSGDDGTQRLLAAAWATCRPEGLSDADEALLERLDIDPARFREAAAEICPSR